MTVWADRVFATGAVLLPFFSFMSFLIAVPTGGEVLQLDRNEKVEVDDPWGYGRSLERATSCPPRRHDFAALPGIRSESPAFDPHHPGVAARDLADKDKSVVAPLSENEKGSADRDHS